MKSNRATKRQAVELIQTAMRDGWKRSVMATRLGNGEQPFYVQVSLSKSVYFANGLLRNSSQIIIGFTRGYKGKQSVQVSSRFGFQRNMKPGLWDAQYQLAQMRGN